MHQVPGTRYAELGTRLHETRVRASTLVILLLYGYYNRRVPAHPQFPSQFRRRRLQDFDEANNYRSRKQKTKEVFPFMVLKPTQGYGFSRSVQQKRKKRAFRTYE